ncbi:hypothetical protein BDR05DRAFT_993543 [Suillus weaverae]|nr:hypothetical protein BDR05DRAFT_993543 [Suillus weaverae]
MGPGLENPSSPQSKSGTQRQASLSQLKGHRKEVRCLAWTKDGKTLISESHDDTIRTWDTTNGSKPRFWSSARSHPHSSAPHGSTFLDRLFHRSPSHDTSPSSPLDWACNLLKRHGHSGEGTELQGRSPAVVEVPYAKGKRRNASAREVAFAKQKQKMKPLCSKNSTAGSSQPTKPNAAKPSSQPQPADSSTPVFGDNSAATGSTPSRPDLMLKQAGLWTRFWLFIGCLSPEYQDG